MSGRGTTLLHFVPEAYQPALFVLCFALGGLALVIGARRTALTLLALPIVIVLGGMLFSALLNDLFAILPAHLVRSVSRILPIVIGGVMAVVLLQMAVGRRAWDAAKGRLLAEAIKGIFLSVVRHPLRWTLGVLALWIVATEATEARSVSAIRRAAAEAARHSPPPAKPAVPRVARHRTHVTALCSPANPCPLPEHVGATFVGGRYRETVLPRATRFHRVQASGQQPVGDPATPWTYWSRSDATGIRAIIERAIPTSRNGNTAGQRITVTLPKGTRIYEGAAAPLPRGPVGGGNQVVIHRADVTHARRTP